MRHTKRDDNIGENAKSLNNKNLSIIIITKTRKESNVRQLLPNSLNIDIDAM